MSLETQLTASNLRAIAGFAYARGEAYFRAGNVESCTVLGDAIEGVVVGTDRYQVRVAIVNGGLVSTCTCPVGFTCKHAVALVLAFLDRSPGARVTPPDGLLETREDLTTWARARGVEHALGLAADQLLTRISGVYVNPHGLYGLALRDTGAWAVIRRYLPHAATALAAATVARLEEEAARVAAARKERLPEMPDDPALRGLWSLLADTRDELAAIASPKPRAWRAEQKWSFDARERVVRWKEREDLQLPGSGRVPVQTQLGVESGRVSARCACSPAGRCAHALALVDATLDFLADPERTEDARTIAEELQRPSWSRALAELALQSASVAADSAPAIEVWWQLERELRTPTLTPIVKKQTKRGPSKGARIGAGRLLDQHRSRLDARDLAIAEALAAWSPEVRHAGSYPIRAIALAVGHPRIVDEEELPVMLARASLGFTAVPDGDSLRIEPMIDGAPLDPDTAGAALANLGTGEPLLVEDRPRGRYVLIEISEDARRMWTVIAKHGAVFPPESHTELLDQLARLEAKVPIAIPEALKGEPVAAETRTVVRLRLLPDATLELELFVRPAPGAPLYSPGCGPRDVMFVRDGKRAYFRRTLGEEAPKARGALVRLLQDPAIAEEGPPGCFQIAEPDASLALIARLEANQVDLDAEWVSEQPVVVGTYGPRALRVTVEKDRDWFGITGELKVEAGRVELAVLLDAARRQQRFVRVDERRWIELSEQLRERLRSVADQTFSGKKRLELSPGAVPAISLLEEAGAKIDQGPAWKLLTERLETAMRLRPRPPASLGTTLRDYQVEGHAWLSRVAAWGSGACLADDMGLGKTVQAIALLLDRAKLGPALVLAPTSVCFNWVDELAKFAPSLRPVVYGATGDRAATLSRLGKKDVLIASYGLLVRDAAKLQGVTFGTLVLDEAQAVKNPGTHRAKAARGLDAQFRLAMSGTPLENHLGELWSLFSIVFPGLLGSWDQFRERYALPIERGHGPEYQAALARVIRPFLLRRTKSEVARELPLRTEIQVPIALSAEERELYEDARLSAVAELAKLKGVRDEQRRFHVLAALTRLRLLSSHPKLYDPASVVGSSKLRRLVELLDELRAEGHRALVFSQFTSHLGLVREELARTGFTTLYLDGATPAKQRRSIIEAFQGGEGDAFLISLKAGGTGLNLTAADYVIHLDPWWNPAVEDQATDRAHRIGQTKPVTVFRLIARGTLEEKILAMHADKRALVAGILEGTDVAAKLTTRDLLDLLASGPEGAAPVAPEEDEPVMPRPRPHLRLVP